MLDCEAPCWYGISPGQSDIIDVARSIPFILDRNEVSDFGVRKSPVNGEIIVSWYEPSIYRMSHAIFIKNNRIVNSISLPLAEFISIQDVVKQYGSPIFFSTSYFPSESGTAINIYYYFSNGVVARHDRLISYDQQVFICSLDTINRLIYFPDNLSDIELMAKSIDREISHAQNAIDFLKFTGEYGWLGWGIELDVPSEHGRYIQVIGQDINHCRVD
jgi:hypothetical protein